MDWTKGGLDRSVAFTESLGEFSHSSVHRPRPFNPVIDLPESKLNRVHGWECETLNAATGEPTPVPSTPRHPCEVLAEHWDDVFDRYPFASHLFDGNVDSMSRSSSCPLCKLLSQTPKMTMNSESHFGLYSVNLLGERERLAADNYPPEHYIMGLTLSVGRHQFPQRHLKGLSRRNHRRDSQGLLVPAIGRDDKHEYRSPYMARIIDPNQTDLGLIRQWINKCQSSHNICQQSQGPIDRLGITLTVIDCQLERKVTLPQGERYLALSYRWGPLPRCADPWAVSAAPRTVRDAMFLTLRLGFRYLWALAVMDHIYESATLTIVAMAGSDDAYGLPGVGTKPIVSRNEPSQAVLAGHTLVSLSPDILTSVQKSEWATRAWTFQEALLSRRCLLFTPDQVYWVCKTTHWSEFLPTFPDIKFDKGHAPATSFDPYSTSDPEVSLSNLFYFESGLFGPATTGLAQFQRDVNIYLKRVMGDQNDGLNAFRGVLSRSSYWSYHGIPLITRAGRELAKPVDPTTGRGILPVLPETISHSVRIIVDKYARDRLMERMISATSISASKMREQKSIFGSTYYNNYTYDCLPGPGEPLDPSPVLAFLHGLSWTVDPKTTCHRRPPMPTWSWVSVYGGSLEFDCDPDGTKELPIDVWTVLNSDVKVWLPVDKWPSPNWIEFDAALQRSPTKLIPELSRLLKIESRAVDIGSVTYRPSVGDYISNRSNIYICIAGATNSPPHEIYIDCHEELPFHIPVEDTSWTDLNWKLALVSRTSIYNPDPKWRHMWEDWQPTNVFLVIRPSGRHWKRVGLLKTKDKLYRYMKRETFILA
ncbi:putative tol protein [Rosellinia necatrix]|uniref:Putative tol protein n=1 Tax=Rosellinia necatrix TaxID=77044 RepID=A0A1W2TEI9_ROSNE|nr:putative tol protein [Rosellinia necatrix]